MFTNLYENQPTNYQITFVDPASPIMEGIINFHHDLFYFLIVILVIVMKVLYDCLKNFNNLIGQNYTKKTNKIWQTYIVTHHSPLEIIWTIIPALPLLIIVIPSFSLLYSIDEIIDPLLTIKIIGHQWYWTYEYTDLKYPVLQSGLITEETINSLQINPNIDFNLNNSIEELNTLSIENLKQKFSFNYDSYMLKDNQIKYLSQRLIKVDNAVFMPLNVNIRLLITSTDVLHSWAVPALGVKLDSCPGRLNETSTFINREGHFFGQCSEICGINHGFMPINVTAINNDVLVENFLNTNSEIFYNLDQQTSNLWKNYFFVSYIKSFIK